MRLIAFFSVAALATSLAACGSSTAGSGGGGGTKGTAGGGGACQDTGERPGPRSEMAGIVDAKRKKLVFYGGDSGLPKQCNPNPHPIGELWVYDIACKTFTQPATPDDPGPRTRASAAYDVAGDRMILFGGRYRAGTAGAYTLFGDVWALDLETLAWSQLDTGTGPKGRSSTAIDVDTQKGELIVFGGNTSTDGLNFVPQNDVWAFNLASASWRQISTSGAAPAKRLFHAIAVDSAGRKLFAYSGGDANAFTGPFLRDLWALDLDAGTWSQLSSGAGGPLARISPTLAFDAASNGVLLFGGHDDGSVGNNNDTWRFDLGTNTWSPITAPETLKKAAAGFCNFPPDFTAPNLSAPDRRSAHVAGFDATTRQWTVFGGKTDCGLIDDVWQLDAASGVWASQVGALSGEACSRGANAAACKSLCQ